MALTPQRGDGSFSIGSEVWPGTSKLIEEMGELTQVLGKLIAAHGGTDHWDGTDLVDRLYEELADLEAAVGFFVHANDLDHTRLNRRTFLKFDQFRAWHAAERGEAKP